MQLSQTPRRTTGAVLQRGWALRTPAPSKIFSKKQRDYLIAKFDIGVTAKKKQDADAVAKAMRADPQFEPDDWVTSQQIKAFWSREAKRQRDELPRPIGTLLKLWSLMNMRMTQILMWMITLEKFMPL